ncbi:hypothetical protein FA13DRAFT_1719957 [Coprinellus micaceus]|uniref:Uncharacterized protein n=1 Tax=Coprinellus micaceus TaxID=71717 RepID=A0A4Y7SC23_COPMI|nr:hypothetical protein FA13DRAFT_1719957 [Coprinellus micaceus]
MSLTDLTKCRLPTIAWASSVAKRSSEAFWPLNTQRLVHLECSLPASPVPNLVLLATQEDIAYLALCAPVVPTFDSGWFAIWVASGDDLPFGYRCGPAASHLASSRHTDRRFRFRLSGRWDSTLVDLAALLCVAIVLGPLGDNYGPSSGFTPAIPNFVVLVDTTNTTKPRKSKEFASRYTGRRGPSHAPLSHVAQGPRMKGEDRQTLPSPPRHRGPIIGSLVSPITTPLFSWLNSETQYWCLRLRWAPSVPIGLVFGPITLHFFLTPIIESVLQLPPTADLCVTRKMLSGIRDGIIPKVFILRVLPLVPLEKGDIPGGVFPADPGVHKPWYFHRHSALT